MMGDDDNARSPPTRLAYRVEAAAGLINISTSKMWALVKDGRVPVRKLDGATLILHEELVAFLRSLPRNPPRDDT